MAFDFPNSPSVGQRVTGVGGIVFVWDGTKWTNSVGGVTVQSMGDVGRNLLHNPLFNVAQRGVGPWSLGYTTDRWTLAVALDSISLQQIAAPDGVRAGVGDEAINYLMSGSVVGNAGAGSYSFLYQPIENVRRLAGKTVTVSFWATSNSGTPKLGVSLTQFFGTGGSPSAGVALNGQSVTISTTWTRYSIIVALPSIAGMTLGTNGDSYTSLAFWFSAGATQNVRAGNIGVQSATFNLWGVQLEVGSVATPLEKPDPRYDLSNCQRFYQTGTFYISGSQGAASGYAGYQVYPVTMRASSSVTPSWTNTNITSPSVPGPSASGFVFLGTTTVAGQTVLSATYTASADL